MLKYFSVRQVIEVFKRPIKRICSVTRLDKLKQTDKKLFPKGHKSAWKPARTAFMLGLSAIIAVCSHDAPDKEFHTIDGQKLNLATEAITSQQNLQRGLDTEWIERVRVIEEYVNRFSDLDRAQILNSKVYATILATERLDIQFNNLVHDLQSSSDAGAVIESYNQLTLRIIALADEIPRGAKPHIIVALTPVILELLEKYPLRSGERKRIEELTEKLLESLNF